MNSISVHRRGIGEKDVVAVYDVSGCIRCWGRRGILSGGLVGFVVGAIFVSNPPAADVLTFGAIGTLIVCVIECAVVGGALGALLAAFNSRGHAEDFSRTKIFPLESGTQHPEVIATFL